MVVRRRPDRCQVAAEQALTAHRLGSWMASDLSNEGEDFFSHTGPFIFFPNFLSSYKTEAARELPLSRAGYIAHFRQFSNSGICEQGTVTHVGSEVECLAVSLSLSSLCPNPRPPALCLAG